MSLILDALNRADNERKNQDTVPGLNTVHSAPAIVFEKQPANKSGLYIAIAVSIVTLTASVFWFVSKPEQKKDVAANAADALNINSSVPYVAQAPSGLPAKQDPPEVDAVAPSMVEEKPAESMIAPKPAVIVEQLYSAPDTQTIPADPQVNELYAAEESVGSESIEEPFANPPTHITDVTTGRLPVEAGPVRNFASISNVQDFNELPWNTKQQIPTISYQRHNFLAGGVSSVVINGQTLGEGNIATSSQLIVQEIFEDGVVLKRGNTVFKLRALNGWINM